jgi:phosphatidylinositol alpha-1,6-mannosyltransferase
MRSSSQRILIATNEFRPAVGGVATYSYEVARALQAFSREVVVVAGRKHATATEFDQSQPFAVHRMGESASQPYRHMVRLLALAKHIRAFQPTYLWASDWRMGLAVAINASRYSIPFMVSAYGSEILPVQTSNWKRKLALAVFKRADAVLGISRYTTDLLRGLGVPGSKLHLISMGVDPDTYCEKPTRVEEINQRFNLAGRKVILSLARLTPRKGQDVVIRALPRVLRNVPNAVYLVAGHGEDEKRLRQLVVDHHLEGKVIFAGCVEEAEKAAYYQACDVYIMLSRQAGHLVEGFGLTYLEAAACGKPLVGGRHGGTVDVITHGITGLLVDPTDHRAAAVALTRLLTDEKLAQELGQNGRRMVETSANWTETARQTIGIMERAV